MQQGIYRALFTRLVCVLEESRRLPSDGQAAFSFELSRIHAAQLLRKPFLNGELARIHVELNSDRQPWTDDLAIWSVEVDHLRRSPFAGMDRPGFGVFHLKSI